MFEYVWILLPIGLLIGWLAAKKDIAKKQKILHYLNLRYLLEEQTKETTQESAIDLPHDADMDALNFSVLLGDAFRKRGEIDRAINLHEYVTKQATESHLFYKAHFSLANDYLHAGFFDRAEEQLRFLIESEEFRDVALRKLANLFEQQRDWLQALAALERLNNKDEAILEEVSHLYCELAEESLQNHQFLYEKNALWIAKALEADRNCARANMIKARVFLQANDLDSALNILFEIEQQKPSLLPILVPVVYRLAMSLNKEEIFIKWLEHLIAQKNSHFELKLWKTHYLVMSHSLDSAITYLKFTLEDQKNLQGLLLLNSLLMSKEASDNLKIYDQTFQHLIDYYAKFQCDKCGLVTKILQWQCPSCKQWNVDSPISDIISLKQ